MRVAGSLLQRISAKKMAEPLYALGEGLHWAPTSAPRGQFVAIQDRVDASGAFLVHHFLALFLKAGHRVCFLNFSHSREHYTAVGRKLGVNLASSVEKQSLRIIDGFDQVETAPRTATELFQQLRNEVATAIVPVSIVIDDLSSLKWQWGRAQLVQFLRCCRALTAESHGQANIIVLGHSDVDPMGTASESSQSLDSLAPMLAEISTVVLSVAPLPSGYFKDVHGTISVQRQCLGLDGVYDKSVMSFKVLENTVKCFASGGDALRSM